METILLGIDGTASVSGAAYRNDMKQSFVNYIIHRSTANVKHYVRGPGFDGLDMFAIVEQGCRFVSLASSMNPTASILLTGYSRGAAGVIGVAKALADQGVEVSGMMLFDPVDRSPTSFAQHVPDNVVRVVQARRDLNTFSRTSFNNCGNHWHYPTRCTIRYFWGTHGAMGGVPWHPQLAEREDDFVSEGESELMLIRATYDLAKIAWERSPSPAQFDPRTGGEFIDERLAYGNHSRVTYRQDAEAARAVWNWAHPYLEQMHFL